MKPLPPADHFEVSTEYYQEILAWNRQHSSANNAEFLDKLDRYHLGCNLKGRKVMTDLVERFGSRGFNVSGRRLLDLGSGTGGALYGAACLGADYCEGWEVNDVKLRLSGVNLNTLARRELRDRITVLKRDMASGLVSGDKPFDIVICQEVLEHVKDIPSALTGLWSCISPVKGIAYISVPNGFSVNSILSEPHVMVFGLSLLSPPDSGQLAALIKNHLNYCNMMGTYCTHDEYTRAFEAAGLDWTAVHRLPVCTAADGRLLLTKIQSTWSQIRQSWLDRIPNDLLKTLDKVVDAYLSKILDRLDEAEFHPEAFTTDYHLDSFEFLLTHQ